MDVHNKQIGKPVSAPIFSNTQGKKTFKLSYLKNLGAGIAGTSPPFQGATSSLERGPSSAYFSASSPRQIDSSFAPSPTSPLGDIYPQQYQQQRHSLSESPRSPPLVAHIEQKRPQSPPVAKKTSWTTLEDQSYQLRSPRLISGLDSRTVESHQDPSKKLGYTVAQYGESGPQVETYKSPQKYSTSITTKRYFGGRQELIEPEADYPTGDNYSEVVKPHKYFDKDEESNRQQKNNHRHTHIHQQQPDSEIAQFEMTRSTELTLYRNENSSHSDLSQQRFPPKYITDEDKITSFRNPRDEPSFVRSSYNKIPNFNRERSSEYPEKTQNLHR